MLRGCWSDLVGIGGWSVPIPIWDWWLQRPNRWWLEIPYECAIESTIPAKFSSVPAVDIGGWSVPVPVWDWWLQRPNRVPEVTSSPGGESWRCPR